MIEHPDLTRLTEIAEKHIAESADHFDGNDFAQGYDLWRLVASEYYGVPTSMVTETHRDALREALGLDQ